jgi:hypothetical protein
MSKQTSKFTDEDLAFLGVERKVDGETVKVQYVKNLEYPVKQQYENIYKRVIDPDFVLCFHCGNEVFSMVEKLQLLYAQETGANKKKPVEHLDQVSIVVTAEYLAAHPDLTDVVVGETILVDAAQHAKETGELPPVTVNCKVTKQDLKDYPQLATSGIKAGDMYDFPEGDTKKK